MYPFICAETVHPGRLSIHVTEWFIAHESAQVTLLNQMPATDPPNAIDTNPQGTKRLAKGSTIRLVSRK